MTPEQIAAELVAMEATFRAGSADHFDVTLSEARVFEKGSYRVLYARPKKRMAQMLGVHREVITLVTNFPEQQARVLGAAREWIKREAPGRLEPHHVVVVHTDERGNSKLRDWGRGQGLTVIPILAAACPADSVQFERLLAEEIFQWDPFDVTGPVADDAQFYGRKQDAAQLAQRLQAGQVLALLGIRKAGKTSVLNRVVGLCKAQHDCDVVVLDGSLDAVWPSNAAGIIAAIREAVSAARAAPDRYAAVVGAPRKPNLAEETSALVSEVLKGSRPLILVVDEVDYLTPASPTSREWLQEFNPLWRNIRAVYQEAARQKRAFSVLVSGVSSKWFSVGEINGIENAALSFVPESYLGPLAPAASASMIKELGARCGLRFDREAAERISSACACMPYWVRQACSMIHRATEIQIRPTDIALAQVEPYVSSFVTAEGAELGRVAVAHLFKVFPELKSVCEGARKPVESTSARSRYEKVIERYGLVSLQGGKYVMPQIIVAGLDAYNAEQAPAVAQPERGTGGVVSDWAEELALVGMRRNVLEVKLRRVVLGLIRADVLSKKGDASQVVERVRAAVPSERRRALPVDPDQMMDKLFWLELLALVEKEWQAMSPIFGSVPDLKSHGQVINERPDAHGKSFDAADLALWKRSLEWFESRMSKL